MKARTEYWWKCEDCGTQHPRLIKGEPRRCSTCGARGAQTFIKEVNHERGR